MTPAKCPNPSCPFLFDPSQVPSGAVIACPRCGLRFTLAPPPPPSPPLFGSAAPPASPVDDLGLMEERSNLDDVPTEERPMPRRRRREAEEPAGEPAHHPKAGSGAGKLIAFSVIGVLAVCGAIAGILYWKSRTPNREETARRSAEVVLDRFHLAYTPPGENWVADDALKVKFKATVVALRSQEPAGWIVVDAKPMAYTPTAAELTEMVRAVLESTGELKGRLDEEPATLGGAAGRRYTYESLMNSGEEVKGEVYAAGFQKTAYFVYSFAPEKKVGDVAQAFVDFRAAVRLVATAAKGDPVGFRKVFRSKRGSYAITATESLWRELGDPGSQDEKADLLLRGTIPLAGGGVSPDPATVLVLVLDKGGDPKAAAAAYLTKTLFDLPDNPPQVTELADEYQGDDPPAGPPQPTAAVTRYEVRYANGNADSRKFVAVATLDAGKQLVVAVGYSVLRQRKSWEKRLVQIVGSLAPPE